jgi:hypothetical protein
VSRVPLLPVGLALASVLVVGGVRAPLADAHRHVRETSDIYVLPPPDQVATLSLGYRAALADVLWAHVLVSQGLHTFQKRRFENLSLFLDSINELDPTFRDPYLLADTLFTFQTNTTPREEVLKARAVMERGTRNLPLDGELWLSLGQFVAFIAPSGYLTDPAEKAQWRLDGARMLARAAELGGSDANISWQALAGAGILSRAGERDAAINFLRRTIAVTDDLELKARSQRQLDQLTGEQKLDLDKQKQERIADIWRRELPFVKPTLFLVLGPPFDPWGCAGTAQSAAPSCALTWRSFADQETPP